MAQFGIIFTFFTILVSAAINLFLPWVRPYFIVANRTIPIKVQAQIGLLKCYSAVCNHFVMVPIPVSAENSNGNQLPSPSEKFSTGQEASSIFEFAAVIVLILLAISFCCAVVAMGLEGLRWSGKISRRRTLPWRFMASASLALALCPVSFISITYSNLNGGRYLSGFWVTCFASILCAVFTMLQYAVNEKGSYDRIRDDDADFEEVLQRYSFFDVKTPPVELRSVKPQAQV
mmetsp:Transcript_22769/g.33042  ORF Transcript_22769/g.33042 Transcript_22769/m.33042 type:complete len:232 (-) Transcript_22769:484-1179(-)